MPIASSSYPFLNIFWTMLIFFVWVIWIWFVISVMIDIFRRHDISGWVKALWVIFIVILPFLGVLLYLIVNSHGMAERSAKQARETQQQFDDYVRQAAGSNSASEIAKAQELLDRGSITQAEFDALKAKALAS